MPERTSDRRLAAILAADVSGYSRLMSVDEEGTLSQLTRHLQGVFEPLIARHGGRIVKTTGDGLIAEFQSVVEAVRSAVAIQTAMAKRNCNVEGDRRLEFRIGVHVGDIMERSGDIFGDGVNIAARLEGSAEPGGIHILEDRDLAHRTGNAAAAGAITQRLALLHGLSMAEAKTLAPKPAPMPSKERQIEFRAVREALTSKPAPSLDS